MEITPINKLNICFDANEADMFCIIMDKVSKQKKPIGFIKSDTKFNKNEIEFAKELMKNFQRKE